MVAGRLRRVANVVIVAVGLLLALPAITIAERLQRGRGRRVAVTAIRWVSRACGIRYRIVGLEFLDEARPYVLVSNHASPVDIPAILLARPDARFIAAAELFKVPLLASTMRALGTVPIDRGQPGNARHRLADQASERADGAYVVFAEGGIPEANHPRRFKTGGFELAISAQLPVVPVAVGGSAAVLPRGRHLGVRPGLITVVLHEPIEPIGDRHRLRDRTEAVVRTTLASAR